MTTRIRLGLSAVLALAPTLLMAQTPAASPAAAGAPPAAGTPAAPPTPEMLLKRDKTETTGPKPPGIAGLSINEVALRGVVKDAVQGYIALLLGPTGSTYFCKVGTRLYDGTITAIDAATVTFRQEVTDPLSRDKTRDVKKTLYPSEEASK
jgi:hypothetical protein